MSAPAKSGINFTNWHHTGTVAIKVFKQKGKLFLEKVNPLNADIQLTFKELVTEGILRSKL
jgi:hypothetical protein